MFERGRVSCYNMVIVQYHDLEGRSSILIRLIGLDLDGTLLTGDKQLTQINERALRSAADRGTGIVPVTGRPLSGVPSAVMDLDYIHYLITSNGAVITDRRSGRPIRERYMRTETVREVFETVADPAGTVMEFFAGGSGYDDRNSWKLLMKKFHGTSLIPYLKKSRIIVDNIYETLIREGSESGGVENISLMFASFEARESARKKIERIRGVRIIRPNQTDLEIPSSDADKGTALLALAERLGVKKQEIMALGDGNNDLNLLQSAGIAVAMGNAAEEVRQAADYITLDNEHDGVAAAIRRFVPG